MPSKFFPRRFLAVSLITGSWILLCVIVAVVSVQSNTLLHTWLVDGFWGLTIFRLSLWAIVICGWPMWIRISLGDMPKEVLEGWRWRVMRILIVYELLFPFNIIERLVNL